MDHHRKPPVSPDSALASDLFDQFCAANTLKSILGIFRHLCDILRIKPTNFPQFYPKLKSKLRSWKAQALWNKFDKRASHKCYNRGKACPNTRVLVIGGGPCGVRAAIEAQLLGAKVVVVEKRDRMSRNNVLHLWPFVIQDLRALGAKKFFGKFCAGSIDHISIRQLQCILLKVALIFGVEIHEGVSFDSIIPPPDDQSERIGWRASTTPSDHPVSQYEFDVLIGADGRRNTLEGFKRKEFRGKLAIAITANFINRHSEAEARVEEISGVAFIFNQKFFKDLYAATGIDLENIVYYKDETHYFVMTAKKHSLLDKGVILNDYADTAKLLSVENVDKDALEQYARQAADFSTNYRLPNLEFAVNHYGQPDVAMFDFTSMYAAENASRVIERHGQKLLMALVGDSLLEPFWPTGSGCARGFLSSMDACWAIRSWGMGNANPLEVLSERESIYRILGQTTPENLQRDLASYTLDPTTRYPNLNSRCVLPIQAKSLYDTDNAAAIEECIKAPTVTTQDQPKKRRRRAKDSQVHPDTLLRWLKKQVALYDTVHIEDMSTSFKDGMALCAIIHRYRPDLIDFHSLNPQDISKNNQLAFDTLERELGISPVMTGLEMEQCEVPDRLAMLSYLSQIYDTFRGEIPHIKHPKLEDFELPVEVNQTAVMNERLRNLAQMSTAHKVSIVGRLVNQNTPTRKRHSTATPRTDTLSRKTRKRRSGASDKDKPSSADWHDWHKTLDDIEEKRQERLKNTKEIEMNRLERQRCIKEIEKNRQDRMMRRRYMRHLATQQFKKSMQMLQGNAKSETDSSPFEDYSLFVYRQTAPDFKDRVKDLEMKLLYPDREARLQAELKRVAASKDEKFSGRVKELEAKLKGTAGTEKKPKDLLRAIGKIEKTDWNLREIEKKIEENKHSKGKGRAERVPKWSRQQFDDKFSAMERKLRVRDGEDPSANKYSEIDVNLKQLEKKIKEGNMMEPGKVSALAAHLANMNQEPEKPALQKSNSRAALVLPAQGGSEMCHFCNKRVYLMERLNAEGRFFHRGCFRCEYCSTTLRVGNYAFDRDGKFGSRFFCTQHFGLPGTQRMRVRRKSEELRTVGNKENIPTSVETKTPEKATHPTPMEQDALDRGTTPERIEFENLSGVGGEAASELDDAEISEMDEDEWTDRNFGASAAEGSSDEVSDLSDSEEEEEFAEALDVGVGLTADETIRLAENWTRRHSHEPNRATQTGARHTEPNKDDDESGSCHDSDDSRDHFSYQEYDSEDDESDTATEDEQEVRARELRKQEVRLEVPDRNSDSGSDTEVKSNTHCQNDSSLPDVVKDSNLNSDITSVSSHTITISSPDHDLTEISHDKSSNSNFNNISTPKSETKYSTPTNTPYGTPVTSPSTPDLVVLSNELTETPPLPLPRRKHINSMNLKKSKDSNKFDHDINHKSAFLNNYDLINSTSKPTESILSPLNTTSNTESLQPPIKDFTNITKTKISQEPLESGNNYKNSDFSFEESNKQKDAKSPLVKKKHSKNSSDNSIQYKENVLKSEPKPDSEEIINYKQNPVPDISKYREKSEGEILKKIQSDTNTGDTVFTMSKPIGNSKHKVEITDPKVSLNSSEVDSCSKTRNDSSEIANASNTSPHIRRASQRLKHTPSFESEDKSRNKEKCFIPEYISTKLPSPKSSFSHGSGKSQLGSHGYRRDSRNADRNKKECIVM